VDADNEPDSPGDEFPKGIESNRAAAEKKDARPNLFTRVQQLSEVPGFTPELLAMSAPYFSTSGSGRINVNTAPAVVLRSLPGLEPYVAAIISARDGENGPIQSISDLARDPINAPREVVDAVTPMLRTDSTTFQVVAKVEYGNQGEHFIKAQLLRAGRTHPHEVPVIKDPVLY